MKKIYLLFLLSSCFALLLFSIINHRKEHFINKKYSNNLEKLINDSIKPNCSFYLNTSTDYSNDYIQELIITIPDSRNWYRNLLNAYIDESKIIKQKYKKRFDANISFKTDNNDKCKLPARVRISGDWKDHIQSKNEDIIISSLDVTLQKGNINGITKFKLFLPSTRNGSSEVFISLLLKEMGYLSPRTKLVKVNLNNQSYEMIFQEKAAKEMIENSNLRESAILESDESLMWKIRSRNGSANSGNIFPKVINKKWINRNLINQKIGLDGAQLFSKAILESWNQVGFNKEISFSDNLLSNGNIQNKKILSRYKAHLIASGSTHALINHNRRFYYDPITKSLLPIYYDGNSKIKNLDDFPKYIPKDKKFFVRDINIGDINDAIKELNEINLYKLSSNLNHSGVQIRKSDLINIKDQLILNLVDLKKIKETNINHIFIENPLIREIHKSVNYGLVLSSNSNSNNNYFLCNILEDKCFLKNLNNKEINKLLAGEFKRKNLKYYFLGNKFNPIKKIYNNDKFNNSDFININNNILIRKFGNPRILINKNQKLISIEIDDFNEKILFLNSKLDNWNIKVFSKEIKQFNNNESRIDTNLLTSLITIKDSSMKNLKIHIEGGQHEDSLNIINSKGTISIIDIKNSFQDAIDFDFSNLKVDDIYVKSAGNDCVDISSGEYFINKLKLEGCKDKGVSAGEKSNLKIVNAEIKNTNIALVSKDQSNLSVKSGFMDNNYLCAAAYNKKQEFGPSYISIPNKLCTKERLAIQNLSILEIK